EFGVLSNMLHYATSVSSTRTRRLPTTTRLPYTTLFRSRRRVAATGRTGAPPHRHDPGRPGAARRNAEQRPRHCRDGLHSSPGAEMEEHTSELQSRENLVCRLLLEKKNEARGLGQREVWT